MFEKFTREAREVVVRAQMEANLAGSAAMDQRHLLLGLVDGEGGAGRLLRDAGLTAADLRASIRSSDELGQRDAEALRSIGIDLDAVRESAERDFGEGALDPAGGGDLLGLLGRGRRSRSRRSFDREAKKSLELALRQAVKHHQKSIRSEHLLLGVLAAPSPRVKELIEARVPCAELEERVEARLDEAA